MRTSVLAAAFASAVTMMSAAPRTAVRVWQGSVQIPTYAEGPFVFPDRNLSHALARAALRRNVSRGQ